MNQGKYVFNQIFEHVDKNEFIKYKKKYKGDYKVHKFSCWSQLLCMAFGQLTHRRSLTDTTFCLNSNSQKLYHLGIGDTFNLSTLSRANESRDSRIYQDIAMSLILQAKGLYINDSQLDVDIKNSVLAVDATLMDVCLSVHPWAKFRRTKAAIKLHTVLDLKTSIPDCMIITDGSVHDVKILDLLELKEDTFYVVDRGYLSFKRLDKIDKVRSYWITRARKDFKFKVIKSNKIDGIGIIEDQTITLKGFTVNKYYPKMFRRIKYIDPEVGDELIFLTNNFELSSMEIAKLYKHRWFIELFFKWIKQNLRITSFWGNSCNAVKTQIWTAVSVYALVLILKKKLKLEPSIYEILQVLSINIFDRVPINQLFTKTELQDVKEQSPNQLILFDL